MKKEYMEQLALILGSSNNKKSATGEALLKLIDKAKDEGEGAHIEILVIALKERDGFPQNKQPLSTSNTRISEMWDELNQYHLPVIMSHLKLAFVNSPSINEFAKKCYEIIAMFKNLEEKIFTISTILYSPYIPYRQIVGSLKSVSDKEFNDLLINNRDLTDDIDYIGELPFEDLPSQCLNVLNVLNKVDENNDKLKTALLAFYVSNVIRKYQENS